MNVYFYHTQNIQYCLGRMKDGEFPSHYLYGACHLEENGLDVIYHRSPRKLHSRLVTSLLTAWRVLTCRKHIDVIYATHYKGLELIVLLRALRLWRRPLVVWHHQPIITSKSKLREWGGHLFYKGFDRLIFFSEKLLNDSLRAGKIDPRRLVVGHWGADLAFYDRIIADTKKTRPAETASEEMTFISTGREQRDPKTLIDAFNMTGRHLIIYVPVNKDPSIPTPHLDAINRTDPHDNVDIVKICGLLPYEIACEVAKADCVVICCKKTRYTAGLTTVVEALAFGMPVICSRNPQIPVDFDREGCGISVEYGDTEGWRRAIDFMATHPEEARRMGERGRRIAETRFNDELCAKEIASIIKNLL